jgi:hypothetical protein
MQPETTPEQPRVEMSLREMVRKAKRDAATAEQRAEEAGKEKIHAVLDEFKKSFPESLPVFVACHRASKKPVASWKGLNQDNWAEPDNLPLLRQQIVMGGNLAIKLGSDSHNLVTVDLDHDDWIEPFLKANPVFRNTLRTFGSKGGQFWFYATDDYPKEVRKLEINGSTENAGEFRGGKCISMIWGVHENGNLYSRVNDAPPIKFAYEDIAWPTGWRVTEPKNNFKFSRNGNQNTGPPTGQRGNRRVDWDKFNEASEMAVAMRSWNLWWNAGSAMQSLKARNGPAVTSPDAHRREEDRSTSTQRDIASILTGLGRAAALSTLLCRNIVGN